MALPRELSLLRIVSQGLVRDTAAPTVVEVVRRHGAMQAQQTGSFPHAVLLRLAPDNGAPVRSMVRTAFENCELVRSWPMRGTLHVTTAADHHWMREALLRGDSWLAKMESSGLTDTVVDAAARVAYETIGERRSISRAELWQAWDESGVLAGFSGNVPESARRRALLFRLHRSGFLAMGPMHTNNEHAYIDARLLPQAATGPAGAAGGKRTEAGRRDALAEIARRYATSHGPVTAYDLARWTSLGIGESVQALEDAVELTNTAQYRQEPTAAQVALVRMRVADRRGALESLAAPGERATTLYLRADLPDLLAASRKEASATMFLPSFDELHVGYKDRSCLTDEAGELLICPAKNGSFRPLIVDRGRLVGVQPASEGLIWLEDKPAAKRLQDNTARAVKRVELMSDD